MRVLVLHDTNSSVEATRSIIQKLDERLYNKHGIEFVYALAPHNYTGSAAGCIENDPQHQHLCSNDDEIDIKTDGIEGKFIESLSSTRINNKAENDGNQSSIVPGAAQSYTQQQPPPPHTGQARRQWFDECTATHVDISGADQQQQQHTAEASTFRQDHLYTGIDSSLFFLHEIWNKEQYTRPFNGIIGFGQGATLAALIPFVDAHPTQQQRHNEEGGSNSSSNNGVSSNACHLQFPNLDFLILCNGRKLDFSSGGDVDYGILNDIVKAEVFESNYTLGGIRTLHLVHVPIEQQHRTCSPAAHDDSDTCNALDRNSTTCTLLFEEPEVYEYEAAGVPTSTSTSSTTTSQSTCSVPNRVREFNIIGRFLVERHKEQRAKYTAKESLMLFNAQAQLGLLEDYASNYVAATIAADPPKALMAIIAPNAVGGWTGDKLRDPEDGGGAPCPKEFLLRRGERGSTKRTSPDGDTDHVSRDHPSKVM